MKRIQKKTTDKEEEEQQQKQQSFSHIFFPLSFCFFQKKKNSKRTFFLLFFFIIFFSVREGEDGEGEGTVSLFLRVICRSKSNMTHPICIKLVIDCLVSRDRLVHSLILPELFDFLIMILKIIFLGKGGQQQQQQQQKRK